MTSVSSRLNVGVWLVSLFALLLLAFSTIRTYANPSSIITINTSTDMIANDGRCSLREAVVAANTDSPSGPASGECIAGDGDDTVVIPFALSNYDSTESVTVTSNIIFEGQSFKTNLINYRFIIESGTVEFKDINLDAVNFIRAAGQSGGAIYAAEGTNLALRNVEITGHGGGDGNTTVHGGDGGAVYFRGDNLLIDHSFLTSNASGQAGMGTRPGYGGALYIGAESIYNQACLESISGNVESALTLLQAALTKNPDDCDFARHDPDLDFIRDDPRFKALIGGAE